ncbi:hypothetical protein B0H14DRAFT_2603526 [Mycena olivaceomarginata]|nr:hypothetical protein B0H14DRAFT_2603526 [Mycena olivaceomarginata]
MLTSTNDTVFEAALNNFYSADLQARKLSLLPRPADPTNQTGAIAATHVLSAVQDEQQVVVTIASLLRIEWVQGEAYDQEGHREVVTEALITNAVPYQSDEA